LRVKRSLIAAILAAAIGAAGPAIAEGMDMLFCLPGFPGSSSQAQPFIDRMLRHLETKLGWSEGSMKGAYIPDGEKGIARLEANAPGLALVGPSIYAGRCGSLGMKVIAKVEVNGRGQEKYSVVAGKDGVSSLAGLAGKKLTGAVLADEKYVVNVLLGGEVPMGSLVFDPQKRPLKALRNVARGKADAAVVDQFTVDHMSEIEELADLRVIHTSAPVPAPAVVVMGAGKQHAAALAEVLVGMCDKPDGKDLCRTLTITSIKAATDADYAGLRRRYGG